MSYKHGIMKDGISPRKKNGKTLMQIISEHIEEIRQEELKDI